MRVVFWKSADTLFLSEVISYYIYFRFWARLRHHLSCLASTCFISSFLFSLSSWTLQVAQWVLDIIFYQPYSRKIGTFHFGDRHLGFLADVHVTSRDTGSGTIEKPDPETMG